MSFRSAGWRRGICGILIDSKGPSPDKNRDQGDRSIHSPAEFKNRETDFIHPLLFECEIWSDELLSTP